MSCLATSLGILSRGKEGSILKTDAVVLARTMSRCHLLSVRLASGSNVLIGCCDIVANTDHLEYKCSQINPGCFELDKVDEAPLAAAAMELNYDPVQRV